MLREHQMFRPRVLGDRGERLAESQRRRDADPNRGVATGVSFTDQNAQFFAFDVSDDRPSGLAAALLVGGAFTRDRSGRSG